MTTLTLPDFSKPAAKQWKAGVDDTVVCVGIRQETHDVKTFVFRSSEPRRFAYHPGQFLTLELQIEGETVNRCYTLSSTPTRPDAVSITVKRVPGGMVSNWLHDNLKVGDRVSVLGPAGEFSSFSLAPDAPKYLYLSAGSGITPLMSMSRAHVDISSNRDIVFIHSARTPADVIFARELQAFSKHQSGFRHAVICERPGADGDYAGYLGYLTAPMLQLIAADFKDREIFCCGPGPYMTAVKNVLQNLGFDMAHYHEESFSFETLTATPVAEPEVVAPAAGDGTGGFNISFTKTPLKVTCTPPKTILAAAKEAGMRFPSSCAQGMCGTCKTKMVSGEVEMKHGGGIRQREIDQGWILPCCSIPKTDVVLDR
ncbi:hybrid-cluster NAD(P)-dependent oxidoreductase [Leeia oryzae]|uniref:hybrid-cluster NAD(P)-dependent oxidoreductase n=1 Tax=Leeia oryzae TaxID=356662 RepID=UPI000363504E|nr:hybrid-cluster NAD(P)-dependent oxidoreductase [Leeia oryzae]